MQSSTKVSVTTMFKAKTIAQPTPQLTKINLQENKTSHSKQQFAVHAEKSKTKKAKAKASDKVEQKLDKQQIRDTSTYKLLEHHQKQGASMPPPVEVSGSRGRQRKASNNTVSDSLAQGKPS